MHDRYFLILHQIGHMARKADSWGNSRTETGTVNHTMQFSVCKLEHVFAQVIDFYKESSNISRLYHRLNLRHTSLPNVYLFKSLDSLDLGLAGWERDEGLLTTTGKAPASCCWLVVIFFGLLSFIFS